MKRADVLELNEPTPEKMDKLFTHIEKFIETNDYYGYYVWAHKTNFSGVKHSGYFWMGELVDPKRAAKFKAFYQWFTMDTMQELQEKFKKEYGEYPTKLETNDPWPSKPGERVTITFQIRKLDIGDYEE